MTNIRSVLAFNMRENRQILGISQAKLAEKISTSTHYIGMIENERKFPTPEMLERIAIALEIDTPDLFSTKFFQKTANEKIIDLHERVMNNISDAIYKSLREAEIDLNFEIKMNSKSKKNLK